jgi:hypothetical protein
VAKSLHNFYDQIVAGFIYIYVGSRAAADNSYLFYLHEDGEKKFERKKVAISALLI